ncbi:hypothetical protein AB0F72_35015 [Actinoplanes sp. NPDC023936]|uniref:hypothetical protein n=1 Tax=Actinoplanes sp. NPDC023936 TaxID=3154910 RepID=UPI0033F7DCDA
MEDLDGARIGRRCRRWVALPAPAALTPGPPCPTVDLEATPEPGPQQSHPAPRPTEACGAAAQRLTGVLSGALGQQVPSFAWNTKRLQYETITALPGGGTLQVRIIAAHEYPERAGSQCPEKADWSCTYTLTDDKTMVTTVEHDSGMQADAYRKDGTMLLVLVSKGAMTQQELAAVAGNPGLTLFPR